MQAIDDRESRLRTALEMLEEPDGRILRDSIIRLVTVNLERSIESECRFSRSVF